MKIKRVYDTESPDDGYRVLVDRLWPRGVKKENLHYDLWAKDLAPSPELREWFHEDPENRWDSFTERYTGELSSSQSVKDFIRTAGSHKVITLLYAAKDSDHNHAGILKTYLEQKI
ncbi:DUF488 domain-containing protein [Brucepastera parasyntrophica]|nr:DUF488 domain-containing protein [Brucepastera parasyntrophica]